MRSSGPVPSRRSWPLRVGLAAALLVVLVAGGCRTIEGRYIDAMRNGQSVPGIPIRAEKARFLAVTYKTVIYGQRAGGREVTVDKTTYAASGGYVLTSTREEVDTHVLTTGEVFAVDTKRPGSGDITYLYQFDPGRPYPHTLTTKLKDTTVEDIVALAKAIKENEGESVGERVKRFNDQSERERLLRASGALVRLVQTVDRIEYYDLWNTDAQGFPRFAFVVEMNAADKAPLSAPKR